LRGAWADPHLRERLVREKMKSSRRCKTNVVWMAF
jgi:hypothetical protein